MRVINVVNKSTIVRNDELTAVVEAVQTQLDTDFTLWGGTKQNKLVMRPDDKKSERIYILDDTNQAGRLGFHSKIGNTPVGFVFARTAEVLGRNWSVIFSHETLEQIVDPLLNKGAIGPYNRRQVMFAMEICDPVYGDDYEIASSQGKVKVSNFVLPLWFSRTAKGQTDFLGKTSSPFDINSNGYAMYTKDFVRWDIARNGSRRQSISTQSLKSANTFSRQMRRNGVFE